MPTLNLALQGGGSHGAFTWGVLDALLEDGRLAFEGLSGTSAGAFNAVALASGWASAEAAGRDPREGARATLAQLWGEVAGWGVLDAWHQAITRMLWGGLPKEFAPTHILARTLGGLVTPDQANPLDINPLRDLLDRSIDFQAIARHPTLKVFVSATHVRTGKAVIFSGLRLDTRAVLASACLPMLFRAVEIDGEPYWDGGFSVNPALAPLIHGCDSADVLLVQINPLRREDRPQTPGEIAGRMSELHFNASLLTQMRAIEVLNRLVQEGSLSSAHGKLVRMHRIDGGTELQRYPTASRTSTDSAMIHALFSLGREAAQHWLARHRTALGRHGTVDIRQDYLDDTLITLPPARPNGRWSAWRPWLAGLLRRRGA